MCVFYLGTHEQEASLLLLHDMALWIKVNEVVNGAHTQV